MNAPLFLSRPSSLSTIGLACCGGAFLLAALGFHAALAGWLVAFVFIGNFPLGALALVMMMRVIPGSWRTELGTPANALLLLLPLAALAALPLLAGMETLYPWVEAPTAEGFRGIYLTPWFFSLRTVLFFAVCLALALSLGLSRRLAVAVGGLILFTLLDGVAAVDWLESLDPKFHSSGFGLYVMSIQMTSALAAAIAMRAGSAAQEVRTQILGALLLSALLLWAYFAFMQFFILWSTDLPPGVDWYLRRSGGLWPWVEYGVAALHFLPMFLLLFSTIRGNRGWIVAFCALVLVGKALEIAWLILPSAPNVGLASGVAFLAFAGLVAFGIAFAASPLRLRFFSTRAPQEKPS